MPPSVRRRNLRPPRALALVPLLALLAGCAPAPVTTEAREVKSLYDTFMLAAIVVFAIVASLITWSIVRYRARDDERAPAPFATNVPLEIVWWSLPTLLVIGLFTISAQVLGAVDARTPSTALNIEVQGSQWQWTFTYPNGVRVSGLPQQEPPEVVLPVGRPIHFELSSPDVIHSFYVPQFLIKRDTVPGTSNHVDLTIDREGVYTGQCAEFCGLLHGDMRFSIRAVSTAEFDAWLSRQPLPGS